MVVFDEDSATADESGQTEERVKVKSHFGVPVACRCTQPGGLVLFAGTREPEAKEVQSIPDPWLLGRGLICLEHRLVGSMLENKTLPSLNIMLLSWVNNYYGVVCLWMLCIVFEYFSWAKDTCPRSFRRQWAGRGRRGSGDLTI